LAEQVWENGVIVETKLEVDGGLQPMGQLLALPDFTHLP